MPLNDAVIDIGNHANNFTGGGLEFKNLTFTVTKRLKIDEKWVNQDVDLLHQITGYAPKGCVTAVMGPSGAGKSTLLDGLAGRIASGSLQGEVSLDGRDMTPSMVKRTSAYIMQDDRLFPMLTVGETFMFAADFRLGNMSKADKRKRSETLIEQLGLSTSINTYIGDEGTRGISGGERRRVSIGVDIIHGPSLLFLDEPTSGLDSTSAHSVIEKVHDIARAGSTVILTIHQPSSRIQLLLDHMVILARGQLMYQGAPNDMGIYLGRLGRKVPQGENSIECLIDLIQEYDQSEYGVEAIAEFVLTGTKPPALNDDYSVISTVVATPTPPRYSRSRPNHYQLKTGHDEFDSSVRSPWNTSKSWSVSNSVIVRTLLQSTTPNKPQVPASASPNGFYAASDIFAGTPTPQSSDFSVSERHYRTPVRTPKSSNDQTPKFENSFLTETWFLMRRNFINIRRTPELFLSRLMVLTIMGIMMATMFTNPKPDQQGVTDRISFFIFTVCLFFFSSNDAVPAFIQERFIFVRETSHNAYRASSYTIASLITYLPFLALQAGVYAGIVWYALKLRCAFFYFFLVLYVSLLSTNSFVVFVSSVVPNFILGYAAVIAFTALFFLFCGYFVNRDDIPPYWSWMNKISTMTYPYEGLLMNQYQTNETFAPNPSGGNLTGNDLLRGLHISVDESAKWKHILILLGWAVLYRLLFYIVLRFFSKNQRS
ncbi:unnamed protein product [Rhodiola kirilowii]